jgi:hypothetical protein
MRLGNTGWYGLMLWIEIGVEVEGQKKDKALRADPPFANCAKDGPTWFLCLCLKFKSCANSTYLRGRTRKAGIWPPPLVTLARPVALRRVRKPQSLPWKR